VVPVVWPFIWSALVGLAFIWLPVVSLSELDPELVAVGDGDGFCAIATDAANVTPAAAAIRYLAFMLASPLLVQPSHEFVGPVMRSSHSRTGRINHALRRKNRRNCGAPSASPTSKSFSYFTSRRQDGAGDAVAALFDMVDTGRTPSGANFTQLVLLSV
jgi:hypothetical protein